MYVLQGICSNTIRISILLDDIWWSRQCFWLADVTGRNFRPASVRIMIIEYHYYLYPPNRPSCTSSEHIKLDVDPQIQSILFNQSTKANPKTLKTYTNVYSNIDSIVKISLYLLLRLKISRRSQKHRRNNVPNSFQILDPPLYPHGSHHDDIWYRRRGSGPWASPCNDERQLQIRLSRKDKGQRPEWVNQHQLVHDCNK